MKNHDRSEQGDKRCLLSLLGRYSLAGSGDYACQTLAMSTSSIELIAPKRGLVGEQVSCHFLYLGPIRGVIDRVDDKGFRLALDFSLERRQMLRALIDRLAERQGLNIAERRDYRRLALARPNVTVMTKSGQPRLGEVIDISISGASISIEDAPPIGAKVRLGRTMSTVVRHFVGGFGAEFERMLTQLRFDGPIHL